MGEVTATEVAEGGALVFVDLGVQVAVGFVGFGSQAVQVP